MTLAGCATLPIPDDGLASDFRLRGKIGVRGGPKSDGFSASFYWAQAGDSYVIELWGPLGQGRTRLRGDGDTLTITDARGTTLAGDVPETLMSEQLGWSAPVSVLGYWVRGRPGTWTSRDVARTRCRGQPRTLCPTPVGGSSCRGGRDWESVRLPGKVVAIREGRRVTVLCREWLSR